MKSLLLRWSLVAFILGLCGCGKPSAPVAPPPPPPAPVRSEPRSEVSLAELLAKPRAELAALADDWTTRVRNEDKAHRDGNAQFFLLADFRLPLVIPIWREARFSPAAGLSLPPYLKAGVKDSAAALHLARYGDVEAARKLVDPTDQETLRRIEAVAPERNYPAEWTRLVALMLHSAQFRLATGEAGAADELSALHAQLLKVLDAKAAAGPLGADLLARGHKALTLAAKAWRAGKDASLVQKADAALAEWGTVPAPLPAVQPGDASAELARLLGQPVQGRAVLAASIPRAFDLLELPFPTEGTEAVVALFDPSDRLTDVLITYRPRMGDLYPEPWQLALALEDHALPGTEGERTPELRSRDYPLGNGRAWDVAIASHSSSLGALARYGQSAQSRPMLARDFGGVHLDRSFEQSRLRLVPGQQADLLQVDRPLSLALVKSPIHSSTGSPKHQSATFSAAMLQREPGHDLLGRLTLDYALDRDHVPLHEIVRQLWAAHGPGRLTTSESKDGRHAALVWEDGQTRYLLSLPGAGSRALELEVRDRRGPDQMGQRAAAVAAFDQAERKARLSAGQPLLRLPRHLDIEGSPRPVPVGLGMTRDQLNQALPKGGSVFRHDLADGVRVVFAGDPPAGATQVLRELIVRLGPGGRVAEVRGRYEGAGVGTLFNSLKKQGGLPRELPASWTVVWSDLPAQKPAAVRSRWQDDATVLTFERDPAGAEMTLRDCPPEHPAGLPLPPLQYLPRGPEGVTLGEMRDGLLRRGNVTPREDGSVSLVPARPGTYDAVLVWFDKGRVTRIVARHSLEGGSPAELGQALLQAAGRESGALGWPDRHDVGPDQVPQGIGWNDDRTRVRLFWQQDGSGRLYTEWKELAP